MSDNVVSRPHRDLTLDYGRCRGIEIRLKDGALDRVYGGGVNPDPSRAWASRN